MAERATKLDGVIAASTLAGAGAVALSQAIDEHGAQIAQAYVAGFFAQLVFGAIALFAAAELCPQAARPAWLGILRVAAIYALFDAVHGLGTQQPLFAFILAGGACLVAFIGLVGRIGLPCVLLALLLIMVKAIGAMIVEATLYTWFE